MFNQINKENNIHKAENKANLEVKNENEFMSEP